MKVTIFCLAFYRRFPNAFAVLDAENTEEYSNGTIFTTIFITAMLYNHKNLYFKCFYYSIFPTNINLLKNETS